MLIVALISSIGLSYFGSNIKTGSLSDLPIATRVERVKEAGPFATRILGIFSPKEVMASTDRVQQVFVSGVKQVPMQTLIASSALVLLLTLIFLIHLHKKKRIFFKKAVKFIFVFSLILSWLFSGWPPILNFPPEVKEAEAAFPTGYTYRRLIDITDAQVSSGPHTNFPIVVSSTIADLKTTANGGDVTDAEGDDIIFTASDGTTQLAHEVEKYTATTGELVAWVRVPSLATTSQIYMYYGNSSVTTFQGNVTSNGVTGVWDSNYKAAWHLKETGSPPATWADSTSNARTLTTFNNPIAQASGKIGNSMEVDTTDNDGADASDQVDFDVAPFTISAWIRPTELPSTSGHNGYYIAKRHNAGPWESWMI
ncbi:MAG: DUF2341 domain-containing protein, partial [Patescibacteria group bacterium]